MTRILVIAVVVAVALGIFALVDVIFSDRNFVRGVPKGLWAVIVVIVPIAGPILWLLVGRPRKNGPSSTRSPSHRPLAPDDDPDFLRGLGDPPGGFPRG